LKLSISNGVFSKLSLEDNLASVKKIGLRNIEFNMKSVEKQTDDSPEPAKKLVKKYGLNCLTVHSATLHVTKESEVSKAIYYGLVSIDFAHALSTPVMVVHSNVSRKLSTNRRNEFLKEVFGEIRSYAKNFELKLALENLSYASSGYGKNPAEMEEILQVINDEEDMGVTIDFCHAEATGQTINLLEKYHNRLFNVHISNRAHKPFIEATPSLIHFLRTLQGYGYEGPITLELSRKCSNEEISRTKDVIGENLKD
jgi:sugar phosphate isomerase/epimerase